MPPPAAQFGRRLGDCLVLLPSRYDVKLTPIKAQRLANSPDRTINISDRCHHRHHRLSQEDASAGFVVCGKCVSFLFSPLFRRKRPICGGAASFRAVANPKIPKTPATSIQTLHRLEVQPLQLHQIRYVDVLSWNILPRWL